MLSLLTIPPPTTVAKSAAEPQATPANRPRSAPVSVPEDAASRSPVIPSDRRPPVAEIGPRAVRNLLASAEEATDPNGLSDGEREAIETLRQRDRDVRAHEEAHARVGGQYASQPSYELEVGPDGRQYAVAGEVQIDTAPVKDDPEATIAKMEIVKAAALAPAEPSPADRQVAALADAQRLAAIVELNARRSERAALSTEDIQSLVSALFKQTDEPTMPELFAAA